MEPCTGIWVIQSVEHLCLCFERWWGIYTIPQRFSPCHVKSLACVTCGIEIKATESGFFSCPRRVLLSLEICDQSCKSYFAHILSILHHELNTASEIYSLFCAAVFIFKPNIRRTFADTTIRARTFLECANLKSARTASARILMDLLKSKSWFLKGSANTMRALMADESSVAAVIGWLHLN